jgi:peroxiredoxin
MKIIITFLSIIIIFFSGFNLSAKEDLYSIFGVKRLKIEPFAPVFTLKNLDGKEINLEDYRGKVVLLNFWATWCEPCLEEMPSMQKTYNKFKNKGFVVLAVSIDRKSREKDVRTFAKNLNLSFPILLDSDHNVLNKYFNNTLPTSYLINFKGKLKGFISGARDWENDDASALINNLLQNID